VIKKCPETNRYTLEDELDGVKTEKARPPKFSFPDKHGKYRRKTKKEADSE